MAVVSSPSFVEALILICCFSGVLFQRCGAKPENPASEIMFGL